jgi:hypothetical protein
MRHYFRSDHLENVHVDTLIDNERWQHHVHSSAEFVQWRGLMADSLLVPLPDEDCGCDLAVGQVLEHDGRIWNHPQFV